MLKVEPVVSRATVHAAVLGLLEIAPRDAHDAIPRSSPNDVFLAKVCVQHVVTSVSDDRLVQKPTTDVFNARDAIVGGICDIDTRREVGVAPIYEEAVRPRATGHPVVPSVVGAAKHVAGARLPEARPLLPARAP